MRVKFFLLQVMMVRDGATEIVGEEKVNAFLEQQGISVERVLQSQGSCGHLISIFYTQNTPTNYREPPIRG